MVSICIPVFNPGTFLNEAVESVLAQSYADFELQVVDDASVQPVSTSLAKYQDPRLRFKQNSVNLGLVGNWNHCLDLAGGEYICIFHQDDIMARSHIARAVETLDRNPEVSFVFTNMKEIDVSGRTIGGHWSQELLPTQDTVFGGLELLARICSHGNLVPCASVVMRSSSVRKAGHFDARLGFTPDLEMWMRLCLQGKAAYLSQELVMIRRHHLQTTTRFLGLGAVTEVRKAFEIFFLEQQAGLTNLDSLIFSAESHLRGWARWQAREAVKDGRILLAFRFLIESLNASSISRAVRKQRR